jgi:acetate kinase
MLIFEPGSDSIKWYRSPDHPGFLYGKDKVVQPATSGEYPLSSGNPAILKAPALDEDCAKIGYVLEHGAGEFQRPVTEITSASIERLNTCLPFWPDHNKITLQLVQNGFDRFPKARHYILCETAFFNALPEQARIYALPHEFQTKVLRYGSSGLNHQWIWKAAGSPQRLVSINLGDQPSVAAVLHGIAVETSAGFTRMEGIPSLTTCGDLDPTIVLELCSQGMQPEEIRNLLTQKSGFQIFSNGSSLVEIITLEELPRQMLYRGLLKAVGSALAALGGVDVIAIAAPQPAAWDTFIEKLKEGLSFLFNQPFKQPAASSNDTGFEKMSETNLQVLTSPRETILFDIFRDSGE